MPITLEALKPYILIVAIVGMFPLIAGYLVLWERKLMADMQVRLGPMRVGPNGVLQPIADAVKLLLKEDVVPSQADKWIFLVAPIVCVTTALLAFAVMPFSETLYVADVNVGILFILAVSGVGVLGIILGGWASNNHYSLIGSLRATAQLVSYEVVMGLAIVAVLLMGNSLSMVEIVKQQQAYGVWNIFRVFPFGLLAAFMYFVAGMAETNRTPFDLPEGESELVAGFMTEYSGFRWALYFLAEYANMVIVCGVAVTLFLGGWLRPFPNVAALNFLDYAVPIGGVGAVGALCFYLIGKAAKPSDKAILAVLGLGFLFVAALYAWPAFNVLARGIFWFGTKVFAMIYLFMWARFTFPRYRYDQLMNLGWRFMIPVGIANLVAIGIYLMRSDIANLLGQWLHKT